MKFFFAKVLFCWVICFFPRSFKTSFSAHDFFFVFGEKLYSTEPFEPSIPGGGGGGPVCLLGLLGFLLNPRAGFFENFTQVDIYAPKTRALENKNGHETMKFRRLLSFDGERS